MKTSLKRIFTALLVVVMVFTTVATTVLAATDSSESGATQGTGEGTGSTAGTGSTVGDTLDTGWCEITYTDDELIVTISPDFEALLNVDKAQIRAIFDILVDAAKELVIDDLKNQILGTPDSDPDSSVGNSGVNKDNIWQSALNIFMKDEYGITEIEPDHYLQFFRDVADPIEGEKLLERFIDASCDFIRNAVAMNLIKVEDLPALDKVKPLIAGILDDILDEQIEGKVADAVDKYISWLMEETDSHGLSATLEDAIAGEIEKYLEGIIHTYLEKDGFAGTTVFDQAINTFIDKEVRIFIDTALKNYLTGNESANSDAVNDIIRAQLEANIQSNLDEYVSEYVLPYIDAYFVKVDNGTAAADPLTDKITEQLYNWINAIAQQWPTAPEGNPVFHYVKAEIDSRVEGKISEYVDAYFNGTLANASVLEAIEDKIESILDSYLDARFSGSSYEYYDVIHPYVENYIYNTIKSEIMLNNSGATLEQIEAEATEAMARLTETEIRDYVADANITELVTVDVWNSFSDTQREDIVSDIRNAVPQEESSMVIDIWNNYSDAIVDTAWEKGLANRTEFKSIITDTVKAKLTASDILAFLDENPTYKSELLDSDHYDAILDMAVIFAETDEDVQDIVEEEIKKLVHDREAVISTLREMLHDEKLADPDRFKDISKQFHENIHEKVLDPDVQAIAFLDIVGITRAEYSDKISNFTDVFLIDYEALLAELNAEKPKLEITDLIDYIQEVKISDYVVYSLTPYGGEISTDAIIDLLGTIPLPGEIAVMEDDEMRLSYDISITTDFGKCEFTLTGIVGGGYNTIRKVAKIVSDNLDVYRDADGTINVKLNVPARFAKYLLKACNTDKLSDSLKNKVFIALNKTPDDVVAYINSFTFEELIELLDNTYFDKVLDSDFISRFEKLDGLTVEQIQNKIREYERYYNKLLAYANKIYKEKIPAELKTKTIFDFYRGEGLFSAGGQYTIDVDKILVKISEKYGSLLSSFLDNAEFTLKVNVEVTFQNINKIEYVLGGATHRVGFLPVGADIEFFAGVTSYNGTPIYGWVDADGVLYTEMPDKDVVLYAVLDNADALITGAVDKVYDATSSVVKVITNYDGVNPVYTYVWYKDGVVIDGASSDSIEVKNVVDSGVYKCLVTVTDGAYVKTVETAEVTVRITPADFDVNDVTLKQDSFANDGSLHTVEISELPEGITAILSGNVSATETGSYIVTVTISANSNYNLVSGNSVDLTWSVAKKPFDTSRIELAEDVFNYTGSLITPEILGLDGLTLGEDYTLSGNLSATDVGSYVIIVSLASDYFDFGTVTEISLAWSIRGTDRDLTDVKLAGTSFNYNGAIIYPVIYGLDSYTEGVDYSITGDRGARDAGNYSIIVTFFANDVYDEDVVVLDWKINKIKVNLSWNYTDAFNYDGNSHEVYLVDENGNRFEFVTYVNDSIYTNIATAAGSYVARAVIDKNYEAIGGIADLNWAIARNVIIVSGVTLDVSEFEYDGTLKTPTILGLENYVEGVHYVVSGFTSAINAGNYQITVQFLSTPAEIYSPSTITLNWSIAKKTVDLEWSYDEPFTYNGAEHSVYLVDENGNPFEHVTYAGVYSATNAGTYVAKAIINSNYSVADDLLELEWVINKATVTIPEITLEKNEFAYTGERITPVIIGLDGIDESMYTISGNTFATNPGSYTIVISFINDGNYDFGDVEDILLDWTITSTAVALKWNYTGAFTYNGSAHTVYLVDENGNRITDVAYVVDGIYTNIATNAGTYTAKVVYDAAKYSLESDELEWTINRAYYNMSGVKFDDVTIVHDGKPHTFTVSGTLPEGVTVTYTDNVFTEIGTYTVTATFTGDSDNYYPIDSMTATITIVVNPYDIVTKEYYIYDSVGHVIVKIIAENGVPSMYSLAGNDVTPGYTSALKDASIFGEGMVGKVLYAYDIGFFLYGMQQPVSDNFTVEFYIPEIYADGTRNLKVVYIAENGDIVDMNATVNDGKMVFSTTHFSTYAIVEVTDADSKGSDASLWWLWLIIILIAIIIVLLLIIFIIKKNRNEDEADETTDSEEASDEAALPEEAEALPTEEEPATEAVEDTPAEDTPAEATPTEEALVDATPVAVPVASDDDENVGIRIIDGKEVPVRYRSSYMSRLIQSEPIIQEYYTAIKNALLSYDGVKSRLSWNYESFNKGRIQCAKLNVKGKNFLVYLALDPKEYNASKYHFSDVSDKPKLDKVPMMLKVKSERGLKYATELIEEMMAKLGIERVDTPEVDYRMPYESTEALVERDLVKVILPTGMSLNDVTSMVKVDVGEHIDSAKQRDDEEPEITIVIEEASEETEN